MTAIKAFWRKQNKSSEQEYTGNDRKLLKDLSAQAAPALKAAQLTQQQKREAAERERIQQELRVARLIYDPDKPVKIEVELGKRP